MKTKFKYLTSSDKDSKWGITVDTVGMSAIPAGYDVYPPKEGHPANYLFDHSQGRILDSYYLVYICKGEGVYYNSPTESIAVKAGDIILLRPGVWHSYMPDKKTGWHEYWIGMRGENIEARFHNGFFDPRQIVFKVGFCDEIIQQYERALDIAFKENHAYQQLLASTANLILALTMYYDGNRQFSDNALTVKIDRARSIMREELMSGIKLEDVARCVGMSYSWFRRAFKEYTGISPSQYKQQLLIQQARSMLLNTQLNVKEIAYSLNYANIAHFSSQFKKDTSFSPVEFRNMYSSYRSHKRE